MPSKKKRITQLEKEVKALKRQMEIINELILERIVSNRKVRSAFQTIRDGVKDE